MGSELKLSFGQPFYLDFRNKVSFGNIPSDKLITLFRDGRMFGLLADTLISSYYGKMVIPENKCSKGYDIIIPNIGNIEVKTFTKNGCSFIPSCMKGVGRKFDKDKFIEFANNVKGYCICDNSEFPDVYIIVMESTKLMEKYPSGKIDYSDRKVLFNLY